MKPRTYWDSLDGDERRELASKLDMTMDRLGKIMRGETYVSLPLAVEIAKACDHLIDALDLISEKNRKAFRSIKASR